MMKYSTLEDQEPTERSCHTKSFKWRHKHKPHDKWHKLCEKLKLVKLFNYFILIGLVLLGLVRVSEAGYGCLSNPCIFGVCIDDLNSSYSCYCIDGYTGRQCQTNWDECWSAPCLNGGTCIDGVASYNCSCPEGFNGLHCEENLDECISNPCQNGGSCSDRDNGYVCSCATGFSGTHCEMDVAVCESGTNKCHNGGQCVEGKGLDFTCICAPGWEGRFCSNNIDECKSSPCQNGGACLDKVASFACVCAMGFTGLNCEEEILVCNDSPCKNSALCLMEEGQPVCYCVPDFHGEKCEYQYDECQIGPRCSNDGQCVDGIDDFSCACSHGFLGMFCECLPQPNGDLDCNYTMTSESSFKTTPRSWTTKSITSTFSSVETSEVSDAQPDLSTLLTTSKSVPISSTSDDIITIFTTESYDHKKTSTESSPQSSEGVLSSTSMPTSSEIPVSSSTESSVTAGITLDPDSTPSSSFTPDPESQSTDDLFTKMRTTIKTQKTRPCPPLTSTSTMSTVSEFTSRFESESTTGLITESTTELTESTSRSLEESSTHSLSTLDSKTTEDVKILSTEKILPSSESPLSTTDGVEEHVITQPGQVTEGASQITTDRPLTPKTDEEIPLPSKVDEISTLGPEIIISSTTPQFESFTTITSLNTTNQTSDCMKVTCYNGGTCVVTSEGPKCVCRFDRQDLECKTPIRIRNAAFGGDSYLSHLIYSDNHPNFDLKQLDSVLPIKIALKARTRATDGLILLAIAQGSKGGHYTALFLHKGLLQFQFSCGLQTMLLSELEAPINTGHELHIQVELDFSRNHSHCNASLRINDTLAMSGDQPTWLGEKNLGKSKSIESIWLHLGGSPQTPIVLMSDLPGGQGFTGCLHSLRINGEHKEVFGDANDGFGITECGSLACLANPCKNGAICEEKLHDDHDLENDLENDVNAMMDDVFSASENRWVCKCPTGYLGATCDTSVCTNNPCQYGGTCVEFPGSGYLCLCPLGKHGHYCEHNLEVDQPSFSGSVNGLSSYVSYPVPIPLESTLDLSFRISPTTQSQISLLAFVGQSGNHDEKSDHLAVSFIQGYIMLTWNLGGGPRRIFTQKPLNFQDEEGETMSYLVQVKRQGRLASLYIDGKLNVTGNSPGDVARLDVAPVLYIGGHSLTNFSTLPHDLPLHSGFQGCIYDLQLKSGSLVVPLHETKGIIGRSVGQCGTKECHRHACHNSGACLQHGATYTCICPDGWFGVLCSQRLNPCDSENNKCSHKSTCVPLMNSYECDCPIGFMGKYCDVPMKYLSDVSLSGKRSYLAMYWPNKTNPTAFSKDNYRQQLRMHDVDVFSLDTSSKLLARNIIEHQRKIQLFSMEFQLRPLSDSGLLVFLGNFNDPSEGFISLSLKGGVIEFRIAGPNNLLSLVKSNRILAIGEWHKVKLSQNGRRLTLWVEGSSSSALLQPNSMFYNTFTSLIYVGGVPDLSKLPYNTLSGFPVPVKGCVRQFYVNGQRYVLNEQSIVESRNINDCDGTACGGDSCDLNGHCWLDDQLQPHCKCPETSKGIHCESPESCQIIKCKNSGKCMPSGECNCPNGWGGYFCEIATKKYSIPSFNGNSYMVVPNQRYIALKDKRNGLSSQYLNRFGNMKFLQVSLNFSTVATDGMLLWNGNGQNYIGLGLENGFLKLVSTLLNIKEQVIEIPMGGYLTDGGWHNVRLDIDSQITVAIDHKTVFSEKHNQATLDDSFLAESFYVGGFSYTDSVANRTMNKFTKPFFGCLQDVQINNGQQIPATQIPQLDFSHYEGGNIGECELYDDFVNNNNYLYY